MKKIRNLLFLFIISFLMTGCVKFNTTMDIKKDKSMDFSIIYAVDTSMLGDKNLFDDKQKEEMRNNGFSVSDYVDGKMKGVTLTKNIKNIDKVSSDKDVEFNLSGIVDENSDGYIFKIKKGIFKNTYYAKIDFNSNDAGIDNSILNSNENDDKNEDNNNNLNTTDEENENDNSLNSTDTVDEKNDDNNANLNDENNKSLNDLSKFDYSSMASMDMSFNVKLPYAVIKSNATNITDNGKDLKWNLIANEDNVVEFQFELYNMTYIYIGIGIIAVMIIAGVGLFLSTRKKINKKDNDMTKTVPAKSNVQNNSSLNNSVSEKSINNLDNSVIKPIVTENAVDNYDNNVVEDLNNSVMSNQNKVDTNIVSEEPINVFVNNVVDESKENDNTFNNNNLTIGQMVKNSQVDDNVFSNNSVDSSVIQPIVAEDSVVNNNNNNVENLNDSIILEQNKEDTNAVSEEPINVFANNVVDESRENDNTLNNNNLTIGQMVNNSQVDDNVFSNNSIDSSVIQPIVTDNSVVNNNIVDLNNSLLKEHNIENSKIVDDGSFNVFANNDEKQISNQNEDNDLIAEVQEKDIDRNVGFGQLFQELSQDDDINS